MLARSLATLSALLAIAALAPGCAAEDGTSNASEEQGESTEAIIGGKSTYSYPAVGVTVNGGSTGCSATLVRSNVVLLAGHCFEPGRTEISPWQFEIRKSATETYRYPTGRGWVNSRAGAGNDDIALLRLEQHVPASVAAPLAIAQGFPAVGNSMRQIGFGCTQRNANGVGQGTKRVISFKWGENADASCPGDSGGALIAFPSSQVVGVISGFRNDGSNDDIFGWVPSHYDLLTGQIAALSR